MELMKLSDFVFAFPALLLAIMLTCDLRPGRRQRHYRHWNL